MKYFILSCYLTIDRLLHVDACSLFFSRNLVKDAGQEF